MAQDSDRWGFYDYYGNAGGKSQTSQTGIDGQLMQSQARGTLGNGRICWHCSERSYGHCLGGTAMIGDPKRHGAAYCTGEDYFCFASERRIIRHDGNDYNFEYGQPWSEGPVTAPVYQEENINHASSNMSKDTNIKVEMGCQQPHSCLRQMNMNYKIDMGMPVSPSLRSAARGSVKFSSGCYSKLQPNLVPSHFWNQFRTSGTTLKLLGHFRLSGTALKVWGPL